MNKGAGIDRKASVVVAVRKEEQIAEARKQPGLKDRDMQKPRSDDVQLFHKEKSRDG